MTSKSIELMSTDPNSYVDNEGDVLPLANLGPDYFETDHADEAIPTGPEIDEPDSGLLYSDRYRAMRSALLAAMADLRSDRNRRGLKINGRLPGEYIANEGRRARLSVEETDALLKLVRDFKLGTTAAADAGSVGRSAMSPAKYSWKKYAGYDAAQRAAGEYLESDD